jgi:methylglutaconyl-CoA hydratase
MMAVRQEIAGRVLLVTIDNPQVKNAFDKATIDQLRDVFDGVAYRDPLPAETSGDQDIGTGGRYRPHVIVLRATGSVFCAGAHLGEMKELGEADYQTNLAAALEMGAMFRSVRNCPVPVVARVQGPAFGGGVGLVAACDVVVCSPQARFAFTEVRLGIVPGVIAPLVIDRIGQRAARRYFLTADPISAAEALEIGLVDRLVGTPEELDGLVNTTVQSLLRGGPAALSLCKSLLEGTQSLGFARSAELAARMIAEARTKEEGQAALAAFAAKKPAPWVAEEAWELPAEDTSE